MSARRYLFPLSMLFFSLSGMAHAQSRIQPEDPVQFEHVHLRQTVDSCMFDESRVSVSFDGRTIVVVEPQNACLLPGPPEVVDVQLGAFPVGEYRVEVRYAADQPPVERLDLVVSGLVLPAVFPPPPVPLANHSGVWWTTGEAGWGLSLHQGALNQLFGALFVFGANGEREWYTLQGGQWTTSTRWEGPVVRTSGAPWLVPMFDASRVSSTQAGSVVLDFTMVPGRENLATMTFTVGGSTITKTISRIRL